MRAKDIRSGKPPVLYELVPKPTCNGKLLLCAVLRRAHGSRNPDHFGYWPMGRCWEGNACYKCPKTPTTGICTIYRKQGTRCFDVKL